MGATAFWTFFASRPAIRAGHGVYANALIERDSFDWSLHFLRIRHSSDVQGRRKTRDDTCERLLPKVFILPTPVFHNPQIDTVKYKREKQHQFHIQDTQRQKTISTISSGFDV
jgi:hypothetical protein